MQVDGSKVVFSKKKEFKETENICLKCGNDMQQVTTCKIEVLPKEYIDLKIYFSYPVNETFEYKANIKMAKVELMNKQVEIDFEFIQNQDLVKLRFNLKGKYELKLLFTDLYGNKYIIKSTFQISDDKNKPIIDEVKEDKSSENS